MRTKLLPCLLIIVAVVTHAVAQQRRVFEGATLILPSAKLRFTRALRLHRLFYEVGRSRIYPTKQQFSTPPSGIPAIGWTKTDEMPDGRKITVSIFLVDPDAAAAWSNWWTYLYGPDILVSPVWERGKRE